MVKKWTKSSYFDEEKLKFPYLHHRLLHVASPPASQNEKKRKLQLQTMLGSFLLL
jgi:hypothetical protein